MRKYFFFFALFSVLACNNSKDKASTGLNKSTVTINLPFESSNYEDTKNFTLYDSLGKVCVAELDTITKGGGTIIYKDLPNGTYTYLIKTIFGEDIKKSVKIDSNIYIDFYDNCYDVKHVIELDSIRTANKIDILIETMKDFDTSKVDAFKLEKNGNQYFLKYNLNNSKGWSQPSLVDSVKLINALTEFETSIIGLREMGIKEKDFGYMGANSVYLKCDNQFLQVWNLKESYLNSAVRRLKEALIRN
ncbi:MAG: hypothetical protein JNK27_13390 [Chitinophagaceae bacterium]|nr:hypothetical protein [Chitinophagaceae bacterium]